MNSPSSRPTVVNSAEDPNANIADADLSTTISLLSSLTGFADSTLSSLSSLLSVSTPLSDPTFSQCPFDSRHRMPPESLFHHSLRCPSAPFASRIDVGLCDYFRYPMSLKSEAEVQKENEFVWSSVNAEEELCFSIDGEFSDFGVGTAFFYRGCPGVVSSPAVDGSGRNFTLPGFLAVECANYRGGVDAEDGISDGECGGIMPSELWWLRREVGSWKDFPRSYSYMVLHVVSRLDRVGSGVMAKWVIANSPRYGILIDAPIRDHILLLLKLCLKAMLREGSRSMKFTFGKMGASYQLNPEATVDCPLLAGGMTWLASQLCILYGEMNGKLFAIDMLKETLIQAGKDSLSFAIDGYLCKEDSPCCSWGSAVMDGVCRPEVTGDGGGVKRSRSVCSGQVFVSQIASAVSALHERSLIESKIKELCSFQTLPAYQRFNEHSCRSTHAEEERVRRSNYKPLLEHDGLVLYQSRQQVGQDKPKTREELLAEERDYKRRRMSYRGKKDKRTASQILHDIIEEHMEEIRQAGGIGCDADVGTDNQHPGSYPQTDASMEFSEAKRSVNLIFENNNVNANSYKFAYVEHDTSSMLTEDNSINDISNVICDSKRVPLKPQPYHCETERRYKRYIHGYEAEAEYGSRSPSYCSYPKSSYRFKNQKQSGVEMPEHISNRHHSRGSRNGKKEPYIRSSYHDNPSKRSTVSPRSADRKSGRNHEGHRSESMTQNVFEDRYDPSSSYDGSYDS